MGDPLEKKKFGKKSFNAEKKLKRGTLQYRPVGTPCYADKQGNLFGSLR